MISRTYLTMGAETDIRFVLVRCCKESGRT
jgi:hypothetical protein